MSIIHRDVPNQPLFVWQIHRSVITFKGTAVGDYGNKIAVTTLKRAIDLDMYPLPVKVIPPHTHRKFLIHGYAFSLGWFLGATRFRFPIIVRVWNYVSSGIMIVSTIIHKVGEMKVTAQAVTVKRHPLTYFVTHASEQKIKLLFQSGIHKFNRYVMHQADTLLTRFKSMFNSDTKLHKKNVPMSANIASSDKVSPAKMRVSLLNSDIAKRLKLFVDVRLYVQSVSKVFVDIRHYMDSQFKLKADIGLYDVKRTNRATVDLSAKYNKSIRKMSVRLNTAVVQRMQKLSVRLIGSTLHSLHKLSILIRPTPIYRTIRMLAHVRREHDKGILAWLVVAVRTYWVENLVRLKACLNEYEVSMPVSLKVHLFKIGNLLSIKTHLHVFDAKSLFVRAHVYAFEAKSVIKTSLRKMIAGIRSLIAHLKGRRYTTLLTAHLTKLGFRKFLNIHTTELIQDYDRKISLLAEQYRGYLDIMLSFSEEGIPNIVIEADVLPFIGITNLMLGLLHLPYVHRVNVMISVCNTHVSSYIHMIAEEAKDFRHVGISACETVTISLLQWYLHGGRISNEGMSNNVVFDLGEVSPIGPIPPVPGLVWEGGYVEDPFLGASYVPADNSTGYGSPDPDKWVQNVRMLWDGMSPPFQDPNETGGGP